LINSLADKEREKIWECEKSKILPTKIQYVAHRSLGYIIYLNLIESL